MASRLKRLRQMEEERLASGATRATALETEADRARSEFDAAAYAREVGGAQFEDVRKQLGRDVESLRGQQVGSGRIDTGFGYEDEDRLVEGSYDELMRSYARNAFQAASMNLSNIQGQTYAAENARERDYDLMVGATDRAQAVENEKRRKRSQRWGALGGIAGAGLGFVLGGPAGAAVGARVGGAAGSSI